MTDKEKWYEKTLEWIEKYWGVVKWLVIGVVTAIIGATVRMVIGG